MTKGLRPPQRPVLSNGVALAEIAVTVALAERQDFDKRAHLFCRLAFVRRRRGVTRLRVQNRPFLRECPSDSLACLGSWAQEL